MREIFAKHPHWQQVLAIVEKLNQRGFIAYLAGGAVRDALLGRAMHDFDIATDALPDDLAKIFPNALDIGKQFGIMMVPLPHGEKIEIATFRSDGNYLDGRHPESVSFSNAEEDAKRRDFTVNALFFDLNKDRVIDYVGGLNDLKSGVICAVGDPHKRFAEDKLRLLRAVRFSAQLGFKVEPETHQAIKELATEIRVVSRERITAELERLAQAHGGAAIYSGAATYGVADGFSELVETGLFAAIFETLHFVQSEALRQKFELGLSRLTGVGSLELILALMIVLEKENGGSGDGAFARLSLSRAAQDRVHFLVRGTDQLKSESEDVLLLLNTEDGPLLSEFAFTLETIGSLNRGRMGQYLEQFLKLADSSGKLPRPFITGDDLKKLGFTPGPKFGEILADIYRKQLRGELQTRDDALKSAKTALS